MKFVFMFVLFVLRFTFSQLISVLYNEFYDKHLKRQSNFFIAFSNLMARTVFSFLFSREKIFYTCRYMKIILIGRISPFKVALCTTEDK